MFKVKWHWNCLVSAKQNHVIMHFLTSDTNNWSGPVNIWSGPAASGSNRPDCLAAKRINVEPCGVWILVILQVSQESIPTRWGPWACCFRDFSLNLGKNWFQRIFESQRHCLNSRHVYSVRLLLVWGFKPCQWCFSYLRATVHKSMFPGLF